MFGTQAECKKDPKLLERKREKGNCRSRSKKAKLSLPLVFMEKLRKYVQGQRERERARTKDLKRSSRRVPK